MTRNLKELLDNESNVVFIVIGEPYKRPHLKKLYTGSRRPNSLKAALTRETKYGKYYSRLFVDTISDIPKDYTLELYS